MKPVLTDIHQKDQDSGRICQGHIIHMLTDKIL